MRRLETDSETGDLPTVTLYRQDLDEIAELVKRGGGPNSRFSITSDGFEFESLDELHKERGNRVRALRIDGGPISLEINPRSVFLHGRSTPEAQVIKRIVLRQRRLLGSVWQIPAWIVSLLGWTLLVAVLINLALVGVTRGRLLATLPPIVLLSLTAVLIPPRSKVILVRRHEHQTFWGRHAGDFVKAGIGLGGTVIGYLIRYLQEPPTGP